MTMNFGILKSRIENTLLESYKKGTFKDELKNFKRYVLENKNISKIYYLYDDLSTNKGIDNSLVSDYINECITVYENTVNKINESDINKIKNWVKNTNIENQYKNIDNLFTNNVLMIESRLESRKIISETLKKKSTVNSETPLIPISTMINIANKTITNYIESLNESDKKELVKILSEDDSKYIVEFENIKENVVNKLTSLKSETLDSSTKLKIDETLSKVLSEKYDKLSYFKLKGLNENI
jgi:hypothetical protein